MTGGSERSAAAERISVVIPFFGPRDHLRASLGSVLAQSVSVSEIWVVDDGSPEPLTRADLGGDARIHLVRQENKGPAAARNAAMRQAQGDWIAFLDADDRWHPRKLQLQLAAAARHPDAGLIATRFRRWCEADEGLLAEWLSRDPASARERAIGLLDLVSGNPIPNSSVLVRRSVMLEVGWQDEMREAVSVEDWDYWLRIADRHSLYQVAAELVLWYRHPEALSLRTGTALKEMQTRYVLDRHEAWLRPRLGERVWAEAQVQWDQFFGLRFLRREGDRRAARSRLFRALRRRPLRAGLYRAALLTLLPCRRAPVRLGAAAAPQAGGEA